MPSSLVDIEAVRRDEDVVATAQSGYRSLIGVNHCGGLERTLTSRTGSSTG